MLYINTRLELKAHIKFFTSSCRGFYFRIFVGGKSELSAVLEFSKALKIPHRRRKNAKKMLEYKDKKEMKLKRCKIKNGKKGRKGTR